MKTRAHTPAPSTRAVPVRIHADTRAPAVGPSPGNRVLQRLMRAAPAAGWRAREQERHAADPLEREASLAAQRLAQGQPAGPLNASPALLRDAAQGAALPLAALPDAARGALQQPGQPLQAPVREHMEQHFGTGGGHAGPGMDLRFAHRVWRQSWGAAIRFRPAPAGTRTGPRGAAARCRPAPGAA